MLHLPTAPSSRPPPGQSSPAAACASGRLLPPGPRPVRARRGMSLPSSPHTCDSGRPHPGQSSLAAYPCRSLCSPKEEAAKALPSARPSLACAASYGKRKVKKRMLSLCFIYMLQMFYKNVVIVVHVCCKLLFPCFICFFRRMLHVCLFGCCICFTHMLQVSYLDVVYVLQCF
jgi:hypothetical protein